MKCERYFARVSQFDLWPIITPAGNGAAYLVAEKWCRDLTRLARYLLLLVFTGCAIQERATDDALSLAWEANRSKLQLIHNWNLKARIAIQLAKDSGSASLSWQQNEQDYVIRIIAPFGRSTLELKGDSEGVIMRDANNQLLRASDPETLLLAQLGWQVPLTGLKYWIRGLPDPAEQIKNLVLDEKARIKELSQAGWQVSYRRYMQTDKFSLPKKLLMQHQKLKIKLVIKQWDLSP